MPPTLLVNDEVSIPLTELRFTYSRSSGPGGQNVNKVNTKVTLHWNVANSSGLPEAVRERFEAKYHRRINQIGELVLTSQRYRDQGRNVADCTEKLRTMLLEVARPPRARKKTKPSRAAQRRRVEDKRRRGRTKQTRRDNWSGDE